jgi:2-dehydropantoate 2-reductase
MRIGIVGAGALGTLFGFHLARDHDVVFLDVSRNVVDTIAHEGIALDGLPARAVSATTDPAQLYTVDLLFLFVRATDTLRALRPFTGKLDPATPIVSLQNGLGNAEAIKTALGGAVALVLGATTESSASDGPGRAHHVGDGTTIVGSSGASPQTCARVAETLRGAGMPVTVVQDVRPHLWGKLIATAVLNPLGAVLGKANGAVLANPHAVELGRALAQEAAAVATALRIPLPFADPWSYICEIATAQSEIRNSMTVDLETGNATEIDYINGAIVNAGRRAGVPTPYNDAIVRLIKAREFAA